MLTDFPLTNMGIFYPDLFPGFREYVYVATPVVSDVSEVLNLNPRLLFMKHRLQIRSFHAQKLQKNDMWSHKRKV